MYKMRAIKSSRAVPRTLSHISEDFNLVEGYRSSVFTFGVKNPFSPFSVTPSEVNLKKQKSSVLRQAEATAKKLSSVLMGFAFKRLKTHRRITNTPITNRASVDKIKNDVVASLPRRPVASLDINELST